MSDESGAVEAAEESSAMGDIVETLTAGSEESVAEESVAGEAAEVVEGSAVEVKAETEEELVDEVEQAIKDGANEEEVQNMVRQYTLKVNGKEYNREIDLSDDEAIQKELQIGLAGRQAMQRNAEMEKAYKNDINRLKNDTESVLKELGIDSVEFAARIIENHLEQNAKSPEQIESERKLKEFEDIKSERDRLKQEMEERVRQSEMAKVEKEIETDILSALDTDPELPKNPKVIAKVADNMLWAIQNGWEDVTAKDVLPTVKKELQQEFRSIASSLKSNSALKALLGDEVLENLREERVQQAKNQVKTLNNIKSQPKTEEKQEKEIKKISLKDFMGM